MRYTTIFNDPYNRSNITHSSVYWDDGFTEDELNSIVRYCESQDLEIAKTIGFKDEEELKKIRISDIKFFNRTTETAWIFDKLNFIIQSANEMFYGFELNGYDSFQYTTYDASKNGKYEWHIDMTLGNIDNSSIFETRKLSLSLLLNRPEIDYEGGNFEINTGNQNQPIQVENKFGRSILFPSFVCHRVAPVTKGIRKSLVVWVTGPKFI